MSQEIILVVEDEDDIQDLLRFHLERDRYTVVSALNGERALQTLKTTKPALILLDLMLPGMDGLTVCRRLKAHPATSDIPIIMLTARDSENDIITGLELGADDYVTKPFSPRVLLARMHAILRRPVSDTDAAPPPVIHIGTLTIDPGRHLAKIKNKRILLTFTEFRILHLLAAKPGQVFSREQIGEMLGGGVRLAEPRCVDVHVFSLRKKLTSLSGWIETVRGAGYRLKEI